MGEPAATVSADGNTTTTTLTGTASTLAYSPQPTDAPDPQAAQSITLSPDLGACAGTVTFTISLGSGTFTFQGSDLYPATDCNDYAWNVWTYGIGAVFQNVPYQVSGDTASQVTLNLDAP